ncbi:hypothetical protein BH11ACT2_BH11ACT2_11390 [soil metagenome]
MIAFVAPRPMTVGEAIGAGRLRQFTELAALHADGWGTAWLDADTAIRSSVSATAFDSTGLERVDSAVRARTLYLRFASRGSPRTGPHIQPFAAGALSFQHNGALVPAQNARALLGADSLSTLRGTTDSELYFALVRQHLPSPISTLTPMPSPTTRETIAAAKRAVAQLRERFAEACLNAFLLTDRALIVVQSSGTVCVPLPAFAERGFDLSRLPPGHDARYNRLSWTRSPATGTVTVATSGITTTGWIDFAQDTVSWFPLDGSAPGTEPL